MINIHWTKFEQKSMCSFILGEWTIFTVVYYLKPLHIKHQAQITVELK